MKTLTILFLFLQLTSFSQDIDTVIFLDPNPGYDTSLYVDLQIGTARIDNDIYASEFEGQSQMVFVGYSRQPIEGYQFLRGELTHAKTGVTGDIMEGGLLAPITMSLLENADNDIFYMVVEYVDPRGKYHKQKSKFLVKNDEERE